MNVLLHTIALEPSRWRPERVHRPLAELLPAISAAGFGPLEVYEPHLSQAADEPLLVEAFAEHRLTPVILSSYLDLSPDSHPDQPFSVAAETLLARVDRFGFRKVRLFPGKSVAPDRDTDTLARIAQRLSHLAEERPEVQFLIETHDHSLADDPQKMVRLLELVGRDNVGLLWQPLRFEPTPAREQFAVQKPHVRHFHLQNRHEAGGFALLGAGTIPWREFLRAADFAADATLEFVPRGICAPETFDLAATIEEAAAETRWVRIQTGESKAID